jgi:hypothetical protein
MWPCDKKCAKPSPKGKPSIAVFPSYTPITSTLRQRLRRRVNELISAVNFSVNWCGRFRPSRSRADSRSASAARARPPRDRIDRRVPSVAMMAQVASGWRSSSRWSVATNRSRSSPRPGRRVALGDADPRDHWAARRDLAATGRPSGREFRMKLRVAI